MSVISLHCASGMLPAMKTTEPYSPTPRANAMENPVSRAGRSIGRMTRLNTYHREAPRQAPVSSRLKSMLVMMG